MNVVLLVVAAVLWGFHPGFMAMADAGGTTHLFRVGVALVTLCLLSRRFRQTLPQSGWGWIGVGGWVVNTFLFTAAVVLGGHMASVQLLVYFFPVYTLMIHLVRRKPVSRTDTVSATLGVVGASLFVLEDIQATGGFTSILALLSGFGLALHFEAVDECRERGEDIGDLVRTALLVSVPATVIFGIGGPFALQAFDLNQLWWLLGLGILTGVTFRLYTVAVETDARIRLTPLLIGMTLMLEVPTCALVGWAWFGQELSILQGVGGGIILSAVVLQLRQKKVRPERDVG